MKKDDKILPFTGITTLDFPVEHVLTKAASSELDEAVVLGFTKEGDFYFASSHADGGSVLWLLELAKKLLLQYEP